MIEEKLRDAVFRLTSRMPLKINSIVLFGSHARAEDLWWSDVDLLIISEGFSKMRREERMRLVLEKWEYEKPVEPVCLSPEEASWENPFLWEVCMDGVIIFDDSTFNVLRAKCLKYLEENKIKRFKYGYVKQE
ncbi:MAG: nucleotidyltransferase domain-containing protein [Candidatus Brockarchaeota archaeon]|nr:nucleotidyltransferase domain-containing protein [Candidatus Brockarchaeota archaeon]MBO3809440.1 nucleotidyltransferase domain-containing protein [Candidatus Brockarchaeota archaeon]